jgi:sphinganine-1-phosphate aldolase
MSRVPIRGFIEASLAGTSSATAFNYGAGTAVGLYVAYNLLRQGRLIRRAKHAAFRFFRRIAAPIIEKEIAKTVSKITFKVSQSGKCVKFERLPAVGMTHDEVLKQLEVVHNELDEDYRKGTLSGTVYHGADDHTHFINKAMEIFQWTNPLHTDSFPSVRKMEAEIVSMVVRMYNGDPEKGQCGSLTTGGTESIMMAVKTYRDHALATRNITKPNLVMPITAHPAFDKACGYFEIELIKVPVSGQTGRVNPDELERYITPNTIAIVGSSPCYPYGTVDPIEDLAAIARRKGCGMHVDACLGGFVVPFMEAAGAEHPPLVDFRLPGVTTISCDTHKFGYAPKGTSVVMYRSHELRRFQYFSVGDWPGGLYASPSAPGSKPGNCIAGTWAAMVAHGFAGYVAAVREIQRTLYKIKTGLQQIPGLYILGTPTVCSVAFASNEIDIYVLSELLTERGGWQLNPLQFPSGILFSLTLLHSRGDIADRFLHDVKEITAELREQRRREAAAGKLTPIAEAGGTLYGGQQRIADRTILEDVTKRFFDSYYSTSPPAKKPKQLAAQES